MQSSFLGPPWPARKSPTRYTATFENGEAVAGSVVVSIVAAALKTPRSEEGVEDFVGMVLMALSFVGATIFFAATQDRM